MTEGLLCVLAGMVLADTVILTHLWRRLLLPSAERKREETAQEAMDEEAARQSRAIEEGIENLMCYSVGAHSGGNGGGQ